MQTCAPHVDNSLAKSIQVIWWLRLLCPPYADFMHQVSMKVATCEQPEVCAFLFFGSCMSCRCVHRSAQNAPQSSKPNSQKQSVSETSHGLDVEGHYDSRCITWPTCLSWPMRQVMPMTLLHMALTLLNDSMPVCMILQSSVA